MKSTAISAAALGMLLMFSFALSPCAEASGSAPQADNLELTTRCGTPVTAQLSARDPDGDIVSFEITTDPVKGDIELREDGVILYTPRKGKKGRDYFGYRVRDAAGNISQEATAIIRIEKEGRPFPSQPWVKDAP